MSTVTIVDYGIGNLFSVQRALEKCGAEVTLAEDAATVLAAERLVLPGVGAFADGMQGLRERGLVDPIRRFAASGRPLLGICLGMQMFMSSSEEFGVHEGLCIIAGNVAAIPNTTVSGEPHKIPHIGWAPLEVPAHRPDWSGSILGDTPPGSAVYLVHSYTAIPESHSHRLADSHHGGWLIAAAIRSGNVYGCQFHPEKSGVVGLKMLSAFLRL